MSNDLLFHSAKEAILFEVFAGSNIIYVVDNAIKIANLLNKAIIFEFNQCNMIVKPGEDYQDVLKRFKAGVNQCLTTS